MTVLDPLPADVYGYAGLLDDTDTEILARVRRFAEQRIAPIADDYWDRAEFPHELIPGFAELDVVGLARDWPDRPARSRLLTSFVSMELSRIDPSMATFFGVHAGLALTSIDLCGSEEQKERWLPAMRRMERIGAFALSEPHGGSDVAGGLETTAERDGDAWVLNGAKRWIGNGTFADLVVVWARDVADDAVKGFVVEKDMPGFAATKMEGKLALRSVQNADLTFTGVRVPEANRLPGAQSFADTNRVLRVTRGGVAWNAVGAMAGVYELARDYAVDRVQFGQPIAAFQLVQDHLVSILGNVTASLGMAVRIAQMQDDGTFRDEQAALAKRQATLMLRDSVARAREVFGGNGILLENKVGRFFNDAEALYSYEGTKEINTLVVGRSVTGIGAFVGRSRSR
ncbi:Glutaryl-CoA dehydrogenase [Pseudonocardia sp. Ae168_Ps1]|uniref:acyl-CoA dehydrogenase family protein n=1 Tax=unclassified Pseudonocardia TaxID=2619320 RepID=UPI0006CB4DEF|nr:MULTISPECIES: acyl-CoA dehydrogenase family protein [unclassified Pseudonocardia]ALE73382.1 acyl-CoA dehydrogenase [Pseudonocardia sp. EC080625-04]ALL77105.1 acyl-CoA dehydrogenase [Pseudonocardia sp. EC080610-09]ALL80018.1 acyl-CoA dehydrogenase [Pseudonocardia sp. EC080619-01]OLL71814.1 Glutaryl-CoA dehydrogenase [Pseudonocardia sp. Ae150A_Ps1]OLL77782.1 Glutaryl-CoA dehydrogenase [Pseudonocardia sp. Ae168_Ps1]